jgi:hypothetical protein
MPRGSEALAKAWKTQGVLDQKSVAVVVEELDKHLFNNILIKGQPKPEFVHLSATADDPERCGTTIAAILKHLQGVGGPAHIWVFPKGIPFPDRFDINVTMGDIGRGISNG